MSVRQRPSAHVPEALAISGANYFAGAFAFGSLTTVQTVRSLRLFAEQVVAACH